MNLRYRTQNEEKTMLVLMDWEPQTIVSYIYVEQLCLKFNLKGSYSPWLELVIDSGNRCFLLLLLGRFQRRRTRNEAKGGILWIDKLFHIAHRTKENFISTEVI